MLDSYNRNINYLRISLTDRCNLRCTYCMPEEGVKHIDHQEILSFEEIIEFTKTSVSLGIDKVRITGGEPLVRKGVVNLVEMLAAIEGIKDLSMTTNATLLDKFAMPLKQAGLHRINISLDTLNPDKFHAITRLGNIQDVYNGIDAALNAGFYPLKINCVIQHSKDEPDAQEVALYAQRKGIEVRFIPQMNLENGSFGQVINGEGGKCHKCNRLRLTANGKIKPCLFSDLEIDIRKTRYKEAIQMAIGIKPEKGIQNHNNLFNSMGG